MEGIELELVEAPSSYNHQINDNDPWQQQHSTNDINDDHTPLSTPTTTAVSRISHGKKKLLFGLGALASILIIGVGIMSLTSSTKSETTISSANTEYVDIGGGSPTMNSIGGNAVYTKGSGGINAEPDEPPEEEEEEEECKNQAHCDASFPNPPPKTRVKYECTTEEGCTQVPIKDGDDEEDQNRWSGDGWNGKAGKGSKGSKGSKSSSSWSGDGWITEGSPAHWGKLPSTSSGWSKSSKSWSGDGWITSWCSSKSGKGSKSKSGKSCNEKYTNTTPSWMAPEVEEGPVWGSPAHWGKPSDKDDYEERSTGGGKCIHASEHPGYNVDGWDEVQQYSDHLTELREYIVQLIEDSNRELIPKLLRLGFHDCVGGICDGCVDLNDMDNNGLLEAMDGLLPAVEKFKYKFSRGK